MDGCPTIPDTGTDSDGDGTPDACEGLCDDDDGDGYGNPGDAACPGDIR